MKCKDCKFAHLYEIVNPDKHGMIDRCQCRKSLPQHLSNGEKWLQVSPHDWCGEFEPKTPEPPKESEG